MTTHHVCITRRASLLNLFLVVGAGIAVEILCQAPEGRGSQSQGGFEGLIQERTFNRVMTKLSHYAFGGLSAHWMMHYDTRIESVVGGAKANEFR